MPNITIGSTSYQTIKCWRVTAQAGQSLNATTDNEDEYPSSTFPNYDTEVLDALIDVGTNGFRIEINFADWNATAYKTVPTHDAVQPSTATAGQKHFDRPQQMMDDVVIPCKTRLEAQGETVYIVLCIVDFRANGYDAENTPSEYAFFVNAAIDWFFDTYGFLPDAIEAILEPDNSSGGNNNAVNWTAAKTANNIVAADALLVSNGFTGIRWIAPSVEAGTSAETWYSDMKAANASVTALIDEVSYHRYTSPNNTQLASLRDAAAADGNSIAMLEFIGADYQILYDDLTTGRNTSWEQFTIAYPESFQTDNGAQLFIVDRTTWAVTEGSRTKQLKQFFKYIRSGAVMKSVTNESGSYLGVPFVNSNGTYVCPVWANGTSQVTVIGLPAGTYGITYALDNGSTGSFTNQTISGGQNVTFTLASAGVATVYDINFMNPTVHYFGNAPSPV